MRGQRDLPEPGEHSGGDDLQAEASRGPIPEGILPVITAPRPRVTEVDALRQEAEPAFETSEGTTAPGPNQTPLTQTAIHDAPEQRVDQSAGDLDRETVFDPAQDLSIPPLDRM